MRVAIGLCLAASASLFSGSAQSAQFSDSIPDTVKVLITATTDKAVYRPNEPIGITAAVLNRGSQPFYVYPSAVFGSYGEGAFWPELTDENGKEIAETYKIGGHSIAPQNEDFADYVERSWILLGPGRLYGVTDKRFFGAKLRPGTYSLRVRYSNTLVPWLFRGWTAERLEGSAKRLKYPPLTGDFVSPTITFRVAQ